MDAAPEVAHSDSALPSGGLASSASLTEMVVQSGCSAGICTVTCAPSYGRRSRTPIRRALPNRAPGVPGCSADLARRSAGTCPASRRHGSSAPSSAGSPGVDARSTRAPGSPFAGVGRRDRACQASHVGEAGSDAPRRGPFDERRVRVSCLSRELAPSTRNGPEPPAARPRCYRAHSSSSSQIMFAVSLPRATSARQS